MTPEQQREVWEFVQALKNAATIPYEVDGAFRTRLGEGQTLSVSSKNLDDEDVEINEGGATTHDVLGDPDGFLQVTIDGTVYHVPYFS